MLLLHTHFICKQQCLCWANSFVFRQGGGSWRWTKGYTKPAQPVPWQWRSRNEFCLCTGFQTWNEPALSNKIGFWWMATLSLVLLSCPVWQKPGSGLSVFPNLPEQWETISVIKEWIITFMGWETYGCFSSDFSTSFPIAAWSGDSHCWGLQQLWPWKGGLFLSHESPALVALGSWFQELLLPTWEVPDSIHISLVGVQC